MNFICHLFLILLGSLCLTACSSNKGKEEKLASDTTQVESLLSERQRNMDGLFEGKEATYVISPLTAEAFQALDPQNINPRDIIASSACGDNSSTECEKQTEQTRISNFSSLVQRRGDTLFVTCGKDSVATFIDKPTNDDEVVSFAFVHKYSNPDLYLISVSLWEGGEYVLVNQKTCEEMYVSNVPIFSPDRTKAFITNDDLVAGFTFNGIEILHMGQKNQIKLDLQQELSDWAAIEASWINDEELKFAKIKGDYYTENGKSAKTYARLSIKQK